MPISPLRVPGTNRGDDHAVWLRYAHAEQDAAIQQCAADPHRREQWCVPAEELT